MTIAYDPRSPEVQHDPYPHYRELRSSAPVHWLEASRLWAVARHEDVQFVLKHHETFSSSAMLMMMLGGVGFGQTIFGGAGGPSATLDDLPFSVDEILSSRILIATDPPRHAGMRTIVNRGFTPRRIAALEARVRAIAGDALRVAREEREFDLMERVAIPVPVAVIAELLGVGPERRSDFKRWSDCLIAGVTGRAAGTQPDWLLAAFREFSDYFMGVIDERRAAPREDLVSVLVRAEEGDAALSQVEVLLFAILLLVAGNETTTNLIGNAAVALLEHPEELAKVQANPSLIPLLVEEALRYDTPVQSLVRTALRDVELGGTTIPEGAIVLPLLGSANRDERQFPDPDRFDVQRDPDGHLAFGFGIHFCLGAALARLEARVVLEALVPWLTHLQRLDDRVAYVDSFLLRGPKTLRLGPTKHSPRETSASW